MKQLLLILFLAGSLSTGLNAQGISLPPSGDNQKCSVTQYIGSVAHMTVQYSSPDVNGRTGQIWGQLVPYGLNDLGFGLRTPAPWRAGANENTTITFSHDVLVEGKPLAAGTYGVHLIVEPTGPWTWILSHNSSAWGSFFYREEEDALRVQVMPRETAHQEWLTYEFIERNPTSAVLALKWENKLIPMRIEVKDPYDLYISVFEKELQGAAGFDAENWAAAAGFLAQHNHRLDKALEWSEMAISAPFVGVENWNTLQTKSTVLLQMGREAEAMDILVKAIDHPTANPLQIHQLGRQLIGQGKPEIALKVFKANYDRFNAAWPTNVGMARGLSAVGQYSEALKYARLAMEEAPDQLNKDNMAKAIEKLQNNQDIN